MRGPTGKGGPIVWVQSRASKWNSQLGKIDQPEDIGRASWGTVTGSDQGSIWRQPQVRSLQNRLQVLAPAALEESDYRTRSVLQEIAGAVRAFSEIPLPLASKLNEGQIWVTTELSVPGCSAPTSATFWSATCPLQSDKHWGGGHQGPGQDSLTIWLRGLEGSRQGPFQTRSSLHYPSCASSARGPASRLSACEKP